MRTLSIASALLFAPALLAQTTAAPQRPFPTPRVMQAPQPHQFTANAGANCPVGIYTQRLPGGQVEEVHGKPAHPRMGYNITLRALDTRLIRQADIKLTGIVGGHVVPVDTAKTGDVTESFTITPGDTPKAELHSVIYTKQLTGVKWLEVESLTYADGSVWRQQPGSVCRVAPSLYLPVNANAKK